jgi:ribosomal protein S27AE
MNTTNGGPGPQGNTVCPHCGHVFWASEECPVSGLAGAAAGAGTGAWLGSRIGIVMGPLGAIAGTIPCAILGGLFGFLSADDNTQVCPECGHTWTQ